MTGGQPYCVFSTGGSSARIGVRVGDRILDLARTLAEPMFEAPSLNAFLAAGPSTWDEVRQAVARIVDGSASVALAEATLHLPVEVADFVDYYSSLEHATNAGRILRPDSEPLPPNWRTLPAGYHARAGTVVVSGTPIVRPSGIWLDDGSPVYRPSTRLDVEVELGFVVGVASRLGSPAPIESFGEHVFGAVILLDWSARDIQAYEQAPLGPNLGKSFATTISPWVMPLAALGDAALDPPVQDPPPLPHLRPAPGSAFDVRFEFAINGRVVSRPRYELMYWTAAQQFAHLSANGASLRTGDLFGSGTVSSFDPSEMGCLLELTANGATPLRLADGTEQGYLLDGDEVRVSATAPGGVDFGAAAGRVAAR